MLCSLALQLAKLSGFSPIITTVSPRNNDLVKSLGATHVIDRNKSPADIVDAVKAITAEPVKVVYDAISEKDTQLAAYDIVAPGGVLTVVQPPSIPEEKLTKDATVKNTFGNFYIEHNKKLGVSLYANLTQLLESGDIKPNPVDVVSGGLGSVNAQLQRLKRGEVSGRKVIVRPPETA